MAGVLAGSINTDDRGSGGCRETLQHKDGVFCFLFLPIILALMNQVGMRTSSLKRENKMPRFATLSLIFIFIF